MSLIPSESYSFPDHFSRTISRARVLDQVQTAKQALKPQPRRSRPVAPSTELPPEPLPASLPVAPRNSTSRQIATNGNGRAPNHKPYGPVRMVKPVHVDLAPSAEIKIEAPRLTSSIVKAPADEVAIDMDAEPHFQGHHRRKWLQFIVAEFFAVAVLIPAATLALSHRLTDSTLVLSVNVATIVAAIAVAVFPIVFFAIAPTLPRS